MVAIVVTVTLAWLAFGYRRMIADAGIPNIPVWQQRLAGCITPVVGNPASRHQLRMGYHGYTMMNPDHVALDPLLTSAGPTMTDQLEDQTQGGITEGSFSGAWPSDASPRGANGVRAVELNVAARLRTWRCALLVGAIGTFEDWIDVAEPEVGGICVHPVDSLGLAGCRAWWSIREKTKLWWRLLPPATPNDVVAPGSFLAGMS